MPLCCHHFSFCCFRLVPNESQFIIYIALSPHHSIVSRASARTGKEDCADAHAVRLHAVRSRRSRAAVQHVGARAGHPDRAGQGTVPGRPEALSAAHSPLPLHCHCPSHRCAGTDLGYYIETDNISFTFALSIFTPSIPESHLFCVCFVHVTHFHTPPSSSSTTFSPTPTCRSRRR